MREVSIHDVLLLLGEVMQQNQADAKKKRNEAAQHPGSEMKRVAIGRVKADRVESKCEGESECRDDSPPEQESFVRFRFRFGQAFFSECEGLFVIHVAQKGEKAEDDGEGGDEAEAGNDGVHNDSFPADDSILKSDSHL